MLIKVAPMGEETREFSLGDGATVADLFEAADISPEGRSIRVNSEEANSSAVLRDGDVVTLVSKVEGGKSL